MSAATELDVVEAEREAEEESQSFDYGRSVDHYRNRVIGHIAEFVISRICGWEWIPTKRHTPDLRTPYGLMEVKCRLRYYEGLIEITSDPDCVALCHYYEEGGLPHICWVNNYAREDLLLHKGDGDEFPRISISQGKWAMRSRQHIPISPSLFIDLPLKR